MFKVLLLSKSPNMTLTIRVKKYVQHLAVWAILLLIFKMWNITEKSDRNYEK